MAEHLNLFSPVTLRASVILKRIAAAWLACSHLQLHSLIVSSSGLGKVVTSSISQDWSVPGSMN